jgi:hypothetical protein
MKIRVLIAGIAALFLATGAAHSARAAEGDFTCGVLVVLSAVITS